jgi:bifunctional non-homologous end joining protein LigD
VFPGFADLETWIAEHLKVEDAVLDGEIACIDGEGRPIFTGLLFRKSICIFVAFDLLYLNGEDLRTLPLIERKRQLRKVLGRRRRSRILYLDHVENDGRLLFDQIVRMDLEGIVCKRKSSPYRATEKPSPQWIKVKNPRYSQLEGLGIVRAAVVRVRASPARGCSRFGSDIRLVIMKGEPRASREVSVTTRTSNLKNTTGLPQASVWGRHLWSRADAVWRVSSAANP